MKIVVAASDGLYTAIICLRVGLSAMSHILCSVKAEIWGRGFCSGRSMNVHFLKGAVVLSVEQSGYVGRRTMLNHLLCFLTERLLPAKRQRALTLCLQQHPHTVNNWDDCEKRALWKWVWLLRGFISFNSKSCSNCLSHPHFPKT